MSESWTYYHHERFDRVFRKRLGGHTERWDAETGTWTVIDANWFLDLLEQPDMDLDEIPRTEAERIMSNQTGTASRR